MKTRPFLTAAWRDLLLLNWRVDPALLQPHVPADVKLDPWRGEHFVSVVGFRFLDLAVKGVPVIGHRDFPEINLRFYVRREVAGEVRRAVSFIQEIVPKPAVSIGARLLYNEPYVTARMSHEYAGLDDATTSARSLRYSWHYAGTRSCAELSWDEPLADMAPDSEEEFIAEHG